MMQATIIPFPSSAGGAPRRRRRRRSSSALAELRVFPAARHRKVVETIARRMANCVSMDDAQTELEHHLSIRFDLLDSLGVDYDLIEQDRGLLAEAAWRRWVQLSYEAGAAL